MKPICKQCEKREAKTNCKTCGSQLCGPRCAEKCQGGCGGLLCCPCSAQHEWILCSECLRVLHDRMGEAA